MVKVKNENQSNTLYIQLDAFPAKNIIAAGS